MSYRFLRQFTSLLICVAVGGASWAWPAQHGLAHDASGGQRVPGDELLGEWWTEGNQGRVNFARYNDGTYRGTTSCCKDGKDTPDTPKFDRHNPNPKLRSRSTVGIVIIWNLKYEGDGEFTGGHVYNPRDGKTYRMKIQIVDKDTIEVRGYLGIALLGQTQVWKRAKKPAGPQ